MTDENVQEVLTGKLEGIESGESRSIQLLTEGEGLCQDLCDSHFLQDVCETDFTCSVRISFS